MRDIALYSKLHNQRNLIVPKRKFSRIFIKIFCDKIYIRHGNILEIENINIIFIQSLYEAITEMNERMLEQLSFILLFCVFFYILYDYLFNKNNQTHCIYVFALISF